MPPIKSSNPPLSIDSLKVPSHLAEEILKSRQEKSHKIPNYEVWNEHFCLHSDPAQVLRELEGTGALHFLPALAILKETPQDARWHPEGDVWIHTVMTVEAAASGRDGRNDGLLLLAALTHDLGKATTTITDKHGRIRSPLHEKMGGPIARAFMEKLQAPPELVLQITVLTENHLAPMLYPKTGARSRAYRRLGAKLRAVNLDFELLTRLARYDHKGRSTPEAQVFPEADIFLERAKEACL